MKFRSSIVAIALLSSMSFAGGDIGGVTTFENTDYIEADRQAQEVIPTPEPTPVTTPAPAKVTTPTKVTTPKPTPKPVEDNSGSIFGNGKFYIGIAASDMAVRADDDANLFGEEEYQDRQFGITILAGYDFMKYLGAELRAALSVSGENDNQDNLTEFGIYLKPKYPLMNDKLNIYALLGYSSINMSDPVEGDLHHGTDKSPFDGTNSGFSYGYGVDYSVTPNISVFTDIVNYLRNFGGSNSTWGANVGVKYSF